MINGKLLIIIYFSSQLILKFPSDDPNLDLKRERESLDCSMKVRRQKSLRNDDDSRWRRGRQEKIGGCNDLDSHRSTRVKMAVVSRRKR